MIKIKAYYQIISCFFFALLGVLIKKSLISISIENIVFFRSFFGAIILLLIISINKKSVFTFLATNNLRIHIFRCLCGVSAMYFGYKSLLYLTLAQASTIGFSKVFFTCFISSLIFSEKLNLKTLILIFFGFIGILIILNPGSDIFSPYALVPLGGAILFALYGLLTRYAGQYDNSSTSFFWTGVIGCIAMTVIGFNFWDPVSKADWSIMLLLSASGVLGHYLLIKCYEVAEASAVQPFAYLQLIWASIIGVIIFGEQITTNVVIGACIIVAAGLFTLWRERKIS